MKRTLYVERLHKYINCLYNLHFCVPYISTFLLKNNLGCYIWNNSLFLTVIYRVYICQILGKQFIFLYSKSMRFFSSSCLLNMLLIFSFTYHFLIFFFWNLNYTTILSTINFFFLCQSIPIQNNMLVFYILNIMMSSTYGKMRQL